MDPRDLQFVVDATGGELRNASLDTPFTEIATDSRQVPAGALFVALVGERFDAHAFLDESVSGPAAACLVESDRLGERLAGAPQIRVADTRVALGRLAHQYRNGFDIPVVGVTGSNGKTTTKRFLATILGRQFRVCASPASFNNDVGVPRSLLELDSNTEVGVFEVGTNHPGEIEPLAKMIRPRYGVLTSIGRSHIEFFGSVEAIAHEKGFLGATLPEDGVLFTSAAHPYLDALRERVGARIVTVGFESNADWRIVDESVATDGMRFAIESADIGRVTDFRLPVHGRHHLVNATLAVALGAELGIPSPELQAGVAACAPERMRFESACVGGVTVIDDSYNANADSMVAALRTLVELPSQGARIAVLGDMGELGDFSESAHHEVGEAAAAAGLDELVVVGEWAEVTARAARSKGLRQVSVYDHWEAACSGFARRLSVGDSVLVKASRAAGLDRLVRQLKLDLQQRFDGKSDSGGVDAATVARVLPHGMILNQVLG